MTSRLWWYIRANIHTDAHSAPALTFKIDDSNWDDKENNTNVIISFSRCQRMETHVKFVIFTFGVPIVMRMHYECVCVCLCQKARHKINRSHIIRLLSTPKYILALSISFVNIYILVSYLITSPLSFEYHEKYFEIWQMLHWKKHPGDWKHKFYHTINIRRKTYTQLYRSIIILLLQLLIWTEIHYFFSRCGCRYL